MDINIPSQVKTYANVGAFPTTGSVKTIYIAEDTDIAYYWTGSAYQSISIQDLSGLVPYTGANADVDLGNNDLNAEGVKIKGTAGNGHLGMKHQSSNATAGGQETVIFAGADGEPRFKNDGNAVEQLASREWVGLQGFQNTPIVVNSSITAQNDRVYHVIANATFTDPSGVEGKGYVVLLINGTATIGGSGISTAYIIVYRLFSSGVWQTRSFLHSGTIASIYVPQSRTINGLDLTANRTLTTANINDSTDRRYVTDAQATVIGNTSGTNTGDQTFITPRVQSVTSSATVTPTSTNDIVRITAQAVDLTLANPTGTFVEGQSLIIRIKDDGTARLISFGSNYRAVGVVLPTTTTISKTTYIGGIWNDADSKLDIVGICTEA